MTPDAQPMPNPGPLTHARSSGTRRFRRVLFEALLGERALLLELAALALFGALLGLGLPQISRMAIDEALPTSAPRLLLVLSACALLVGAHQAWAGWLEDRTASELGARLERSALDTLVGALLDSDYALLRRRDAGWMGDTLGGASGVVHGSVLAFVALVTQGFFALACLSMLASSSPLAAALVTLASAFISALAGCFVRWESELVERWLDASSKQQEQLNRLVSSLAALRGLFATDRLGAAWEAALRRSALAGARRARAATLRGVVVSSGTRLLGIGITIWAVYRCLDSQLAIGEMLLLTSMAAGLSGSILAMSGAWIGFRSLAPQFARMDELLAGAPLESRPREPARQSDDQLLVDGVWFRYADDARWALSDHAWRVPRGAFVQLASPSGSGKSTLLRLLAGLLTPSRGVVRVFGIDAALARDLVLYVPQHSELFEASIGENLRLLSGADDRELARVAELTGLSTLLAELPMGMETQVAARGQNLSSGQRQLIVLTAAFAAERPVVLLDEATSQIDVDARRAIDWPALTKNRTVIAVEHGAALARER
jgi:ABC-type bacteriocin/lantibiotic exporter with double-glycine peptidase domain